MKWLKRLVAVALSVLMVCVIAIASLQYLVNPDTIKTFLNQELSTVLQHKTVIHGDLDWKILPSASVRVKDIAIGDQAKVNATHGHINNLVLSLQLRPLLHKQFVFNNLKIDGLNAVINPADKNAFTTKKAPPKAITTAQKKSEDTPNAMALNIHKFAVVNSELRLLQTNNILRLSALNIRSDHFNMGQQDFSFSVRSDFSSHNPELKSKGQFTFEGKARLLKDTPPSSNNRLFIPLQLDGLLRMENIALNHLQVNDLQSNVRIKDHRIDLNPLTISLYKGRSNGKLSVSSQKILRIEQGGKNLNSNRLFTDLSGKNILEGSLDYSLKATLPLNQPNFIDALYGSGRLSVSHGTLFTINLKAIISKLNQNINAIWADRTINWEDAFSLLSIDPSVVSQGSTPFERAEGSFSVKRGVLDAHNLLIQTAELNTKGNFSLNLVSQDLDGRLQTSVNGLPKDSRLAKIQSILGGYFPLTISGKRNKPMVLPDSALITPIIRSYILRDSVKKHIEKPVKKLKQQLNKWLH